jgi:hypothetical protein
MKGKQTAKTGATLVAIVLAVVTCGKLHANGSVDTAVKLIQKLGDEILRESEDRATKAIQKLGGKITRDKYAQDQPIIRVDFFGTAVTDAGLKHLAGLKRLQSLYCGYTKVTDTGLKHLAGLQQLQSLDLQSTWVTDAGLKHLAGLKRLRTLLLQRTQVTAAAQDDLQKALPKLDIYP